MKQRLLLALLMLLTSAGFMKVEGEIQIKLPQTSEKSENVTITFTSDQVAAFSKEKPSYPVIENYTGDNLKVTATTATYTIPTSTDGDITLRLKTDYSADKSWGNILITIDGPVSMFVVENQPAADALHLQNYITSLTFSQNNQLADLRLGGSSNALTTIALPNLAYLSCSGEKLSYIPAKPEKMDASNYKIEDKVSLNAKLGSDDPANKFVFTVDELLGASGIVEKDNININDLAITNLRDKDGNALTEQVIVSQPKDVANGYWVFKNASEIYMDGTYTADIVVASTNKSYPGLVFGNVTLVVDPVDFVLKDDGTNKTQGSYDVYEQPGNAVVTESTKLNKGDELLVTPKPEKGYVFKSFTVNNGLTKIASEDGDPGNSVRYKVVGNVNPVIKADFSYGTAKLTYTASSAYGTVKVYEGKIGTYDESKRLNSGDILEVGSYVTIEAKANDGNTVDKVTMNKTDITSQDKDVNAGIFKAEVQVPAEGVDILVDFGGIEKRKLTIKLQGDGLKAVSVKDNANTDYSLITTQGVYRYCDVVPETRLTIGFTLINADDYAIESISVNGSNYWPYGVTRLEDGSYQINEYWMPNEDVMIVVTAKKLTQISVDLLDPKTFDYDGLPHEVSYKTTPAGIDGIKVTYIKDGVSCNPIDAGTYTVKFEREADDKFKKLDDGSKTFTISQVPLYITQLPTVTKNEDGSFDIVGGKAGFVQGTGFSTDVDGEFTNFEDADGDGLGTVTYVLNDNSNFTLSSYSARVAYGDKAKETVVVEVLNEAGDASLIVKNGYAVVSNSVVKDTELTFAIQNRDENLIGKYRVYQVNDEDEVISDNLLGNGGKFTSYADYKTLRFKLTVEDTRNHLTLDKLATTTYTCDYKNGQPIEYPIGTTFYNDLKVKETGASLSVGGWDWSKDQGNWTITYYKSEREIATPVNEGTYKVKAVRKATGSYYEFETECTLVINKIDIPDAEKLIPLPTASRINKDTELRYAYLSGATEVAGYYAYDVPNVSITLSESGNFPVKFVPFNTNYNEYKFDGKNVKVSVTDRALLSCSTSGYGTIEIKDKAGNTYGYGSEILAGTELTVTATPFTDCELVSITKDGSAMSNPFTFVFEDKTVYIDATFKVVKEDPEIDPNSKYTVTLPTSLRGAVIDKPGANSVKRGESFSFSVATLAADASKVVVKVDGVTIKPVSGKYTITNITENKEVSVTLANPTPIKVTVPTEYKNKGGYLMGRVKISGPSDGKYYYNDQITLVAFPESNVHFDGWTGDLTGLTQIKEVVLTKDLTAGAKFSGTPTGIEDIMAASITTGKGCVWVRGIANADVTIVSIAGRVQAQERISGDTRIDVPAGIYVVVLESGSDVKRVKVIVK